MTSSTLPCGLAAHPTTGFWTAPAGVQFGDFNSVLLVIIGVIANGSVALIALILVVILAWNYLKLLLEAAERYVVLGILVFTAPMAFAWAQLAAQTIFSKAGAGCSAGSFCC